MRLLEFPQGLGLRQEPDGAHRLVPRLDRSSFLVRNAADKPHFERRSNWLRHPVQRVQKITWRARGIDRAQMRHHDLAFRRPAWLKSRENIRVVAVRNVNEFLVRLFRITLPQFAADRLGHRHHEIGGLRRLALDLLRSPPRVIPLLIIESLVIKVEPGIPEIADELDTWKFALERVAHQEG